MNITNNRKIGVLLIRLLLGLIFVMQGYGKVCTIGIENVHNGFFLETYKDLLPNFITYTTAYFTSYVELIGGAMLVIGFKRDIALYALALVLIIVTFGHGLASPVWDLSHVLYRTILLTSLLLLPKEWDVFSIDAILRKRTV